MCFHPGDEHVSKMGCQEKKQNEVYIKSLVFSGAALGHKNP